MRTICKIIIGSKKNLKLTVNLREKLVVIVIISHSAIISGGEEVSSSEVRGRGVIFSRLPTTGL